MNLLRKTKNGSPKGNGNTTATLPSLPKTTWSNASSSILNQRDCSNHQEALDNGLFDDVDYYMQNIAKGYMTVGR